MNQRFAFHIPTMNELWYRQKLMQDPETMSYNKDYDLELEGYHKAIGCIDFSKEDWQDWFEYFIGHEPDRF